MSLHPSLSGAKKGKQHRSVLKRFERIAILKKEGKWDEEKSVFGLPKTKIIKIKIKKEKAAAPKVAEAAAGAEAPATVGGKPQAETAAKTQTLKAASPTKPQPKEK